mmetsp:Transcript_16298/g.35410  ORF Transcript_16298/g.35410 Transcript_16298/m.35410 type:complete len:221 (-) Transcript_16298:135-797(-)
MNELVSNNKTGSSLVVVRREGDVDDPDVIACSCRCCCFCCRCSFSCCTSWFLRILFRRRFTSRYSSTNLARTLDPAIPSRVLLFVDMSGRPNRSCETCLGLLRLIVVVVVVLSSSEEPEEDTITLISRSTFWSCACKESTRSSNPFVPTEGTVENDDDDDKEERPVIGNGVDWNDETDGFGDDNFRGATNGCIGPLVVSSMAESKGSNTSSCGSLSLYSS